MDYRMARLNGVTACRNILARDPSARIILVSGIPATESARGSGAIAVLSKPVGMVRLEQALSAAVRGIAA